VISPAGRSLRYIVKWAKLLPTSLKKQTYSFPVIKNLLWNPFPRSKKLAQAWYSFFGMILFKRYIRKHGMPDIIHAHNVFNAGVFAIELKKRFGIPVVVTEHHSSFLTMPFNEQEVAHIRVVLEQTNQMIGVSQKLCESIAKIGDGLAIPFPKVVYNLIDKDFEEEASKNTNPPPKNAPFTFFNLAGLHEVKNQILLVRAFTKAFKGEAVKLTIGGAGPLYGELESEIGQLGMKDQVFLVGYLNRAESKHYFAAADAFALSSNHETFGVVLIEALCFGLPVVSTKCGGPDEIVNEQCGLLVPVSDENELAKALKQLQNTIKQYDSSLIRKYATDTFSSKRFIERISSVYKMILLPQN
jgi:L-malate glycosyltransferase